MCCMRLGAGCTGPPSQLVLTALSVTFTSTSGSAKAYASAASWALPKEWLAVRLKEIALKQLHTAATLARMRMTLERFCECWTAGHTTASLTVVRRRRSDVIGAPTGIAVYLTRYIGRSSYGTGSRGLNLAA